MRFADYFNPTEPELRAWASLDGARQPSPEWELVLSWGMDRGRLRVCIQLAADPALANARFFLLLLYTWVSYVAGRENWEALRPEFDRWLDEAKGVRDVAVKRWRRRARLIFQGIEPFDRKGWWEDWEPDSV